MLRALTLALVAAAPLAAQRPSPRILVDPDFQASRDGFNAHVETHVAANPRRPRNLIAGAITHTRPDNTPASKAYASFDGGVTWSDISFPEQMSGGGADPQVAFTPAGTGLFAALATMPDERGRKRAYLHVYRTEDGGRTWSRPADLGKSYDHPMMLADRSPSRFAGRTYIAVLYGGGVYHLGLFGSDDDGRSFIGPTEFFRGDTIGANVLPMAGFSDGGLFVPFQQFKLFRPGQEKETAPLEGPLWSVLSNDGGVSFSTPRRIPSRVLPPRSNGAELRYATDPDFAVDASARYRDRLYVVWADWRSGRGRVMLSSSTDRGSTWSDGRMVDSSVAIGVRQYQPVVAVNRDGVVGVSWYDSRHDDATGARGYDQYFAASLDGGQTFLPSTRVSTETSQPLSSGNLLVTPTTFTAPADSGAVRMAFLSAASRWITGGDYSGLDADAEGNFHPFWADSRAGVFQAWTAKVRVTGYAGETPEDELLAAGGGRPSAMPPLERVIIGDRVEFVSDPSRYDASTRELELRLRVKNMSSRAIYSPVQLEIRGFGDGPVGAIGRELSPTVLNAGNGLPGPGATFDFTPALGSGGVLEPGATSGPLLLRLRLRDPVGTPSMHLVVTGQVPR